MKEIPRNIPTGTGTFGLHSGQKGGKRPLSAAAGRQMEKPAGQWEWPVGRRDRRSNRSKPVAPGGDGSVSAERNSRESGGKERPEGGATSRDRQPREAAGRRRRGGASERPTGRSGRRGNQSRPAAPGGGGSASAERNSREADGKERPAQQPAEAAATGGATSRNRWPREAAGRRRRGGAPERPTGRSGRRSNQWDGGSAAAGQRAPAKKTPRSGTPGCRRTSRLQHNTYDT